MARKRMQPLPFAAQFMEMLVNVLSIENVCKVYRTPDVQMDVIKNINIEIGRREIVGVIAPSGAGKTTLLNIISGLDTDYTGAVQMETGSAVGYLQQADALLPWKSVMANCMLPHLIAYRDRAAARVRAIELLASLRLAQYSNYLPSQLSGGIRQRIALARSLITYPSLLLLDEPFNSLDKITQHDCYRWFLRLQRAQECAVLMVTHDPYQIYALAHRVLLCSSPLQVCESFATDGLSESECVGRIFRFLERLKGVAKDTNGLTSKDIESTVDD